LRLVIMRMRWVEGEKMMATATCRGGLDEPMGGDGLQQGTGTLLSRG
jgi:hypothetical protein